MHSNFTNKSDEELWSLLKKNNKEAFSALYQKHINSLFYFGLKLSSDKPIVEDTLQELFTEFWSKRANSSKVDNVKAYIFKAFRYKLLKNLTASKLPQTYCFEELLSDVPTLEKEEIGLSKEQLNNLNHQLKLLPERQKEIIHLRYYQNLSHQEIANILNLNYQSVSNLLYRAVKNLRKKYTAN